MKITGQILKEAREKKGVSIAEVSLATKINTRVITAMEDGNTAKLPPKTFLRGFVLSYATFLQLDLEPLMAKFQEEMGGFKPEMKPVEETLAASVPSARAIDPISPNTIAKVGAVIGILVLFGLIVLLRNKMESYRNETITAAASPSPTVTATPGDDHPVDSASATATPSDVFGDMKAAAAISNSSATTPKPIATPKASPAPTPAASPSATPQLSPTPKPSQTPKPSPSPASSPASFPAGATAAVGEAPTPKPKSGRAQDITLEALDNVTIDATIDDEPIRKISLKPDQVQTIKAKRKVSLQLSDGGAVNIIVNGTDRGVPGDLGQPKKVDIP